jgi:DivIVA domain-containing protein
MRKKKTENDDLRPVEPVSRQRLTPADIQQAEFRLSMRGYNEREVDELLDQLTEDWGTVLEENKRLRDQAGVKVTGAVPAAAVEDARREADEILIRARAEAAAIVRDAQDQPAAANPSTPAEASAVGSFLTREREFLQSLGRLVQGHAESVKSMAQNARSAERAEQSTPPPAPSPAPQPPPRQPAHQAVAKPAPAPAQPKQPQPASQGQPTQPVVKVEADRPPAAERAPSAPAAASPQASSKQGGDPIRIPDEAEDRKAQQARERQAEPAPASRSREEEMSLRELFWGDE